MSDNLLKIFKEEASEYIKGLNGSLLKLELSSADDLNALLKEMNRMAHSMKGAARAVGLGRIETVSHYMEEIFHAALHKGLKLTPEMGDALYDGLDLIQEQMNGDSSDDEVVVTVFKNLEAILTSFRLPDETMEMYLSPHSFDTDSAEIPMLNEDDSREMGTITDEMLAAEDGEKPTITDEMDMIYETATIYAPPTIELPVFSSQMMQQAPDNDVSEELLQIFYVEVSEHIAALNDSLLRVEMATLAAKPELLREMNRVAHSMKGAARAVGFKLVETVSHYMEELFQSSLQGALNLTPQVADVLYDGLDVIQHAVDGNPSEEAIIKSVLLNMERMMRRPNPDAPLPPNAPVPSSDETPTLQIPPALMTTTIETHGVTPTMLMRAPEDTIRVSVDKLDQLMADTSELLVARMQGEAREARLTALHRDHSRWLREWRGVRAAYIRLARRVQEQDEAISTEMTTLFKFLESNQRYLAKANRELAHLGQQLAQDNLQLMTLSEQLQDNVSSLRMMPFETIIGGFQRMARDMARDLAKQVHLEIVGAWVEIDKTVLDALKDPLMHLLRNAIDHGVERADERQRMGKDAAGHIRLDVEQRGAEIVIRVMDDGRGLNLEKIRRKAIERGMLSTQEAETLTDEDARMLVFHSGFSTSESVTSLSGRGIGMDVVRNRVESLRGRVSVQSAIGRGTTVTLNVPVSLTRLRVISLQIGEEQYAIPSVMVERMETYALDDIYTAEGQEMLNINKRPTPLVSLAAILETPVAAQRGDAVNIVSLQTADRAVAFEVDALYSEMELVLKPLGQELQNAPFVAGAALLGSGDVLIVLDANDLVRKATGTAFPSYQVLTSPPAQPAVRKTRVLVVDDSITTRTLEKNILEAVGFEVHVAIDGQEAWSRVAEIAPDVIVADVEMPHMDGLELCRRIKTSDSLKHLPVILLTSLSKPEQREAGLKAGANAYLIKSRFDQGELLDTIQSVL
jgi:two-component system chemotaxis sensor kinase CheA